MGHRAHQRWAEHAETHAEAFERPTPELRPGQPRAADVEDHDVGLDRAGVQGDARQLGQSLGQAARSRVVLG